MIVDLLFRYSAKLLNTKSSKHRLLLISVVAVSSLWMLLFYFFSWEEFSFFYAYQNPDEAHIIYNAHGFRNHPVIPHLAVLFNTFGYNSLPYNILSLFVFVGLSLSVFHFLSKFFNDKQIGFYAGLIFAAGYFGIATFTTNTTSAYIGGFGLILLLFLLSLLIDLLCKFSLPSFSNFVITYLFTITFFPDRSFPFPGFVFVLSYFYKKGLVRSVIFAAISFLPIFLRLQYQVGKYTSNLPHISIRPLEFITTVLGNLGNLFFPTLVNKWDLVSIGIGVLILLFAITKKHTRVLVFLILVSLSAQLLAVLVNSQYFFILKSPQHFMLSFTIFSSGILAYWLRSHKKILLLSILGILICSNIAVYTVLVQHSNSLRFFYESFQKIVPSRERKTVVLVYSLEPRAVNPFIHLPEIPGEVYVPGFYHKKVSEMLVTQSYYDAVKFMKKNKLKTDDLYVLTYSVNNLNDVSDNVRQVIKQGGEKDIYDNDSIHIPALTPLTFEFSLSEFKNTLTNPKLDSYFNWFKRIKVTTDPDKPFEDRKKEYLTDFDFGTTWIPHEWKNPVTVTFEFPEQESIDSLVWSVSRLNSWPSRSPVDYGIYISMDGKIWIEKIRIRNGLPVKTGEIKKEVIASSAKFLQFRIHKSYEGALPAIDDILIVSDGVKELSVDEVYSYLQRKFTNLCLQYTTEKDPNFRSQRQACIRKSVGDSSMSSITIEPRLKNITGVQIVDIDNRKVNLNYLKVIFPKY